jgi:competence protein ComEC
MGSRFKPGPVLCATAGAAAGFYCLSVLFRAGVIGVYGIFALLCGPVGALCLLRVLISLPALAPAAPRSLRLINRRVLAFAAGLALGIGAGGAAPVHISFGIPEDTVRAVSGVLLEDPRTVSGGRAMAALSLRESAGRGGLRVSARGELPVFFPEESAGRLKEFGRGSLIFAEGKIRESRTAGQGSPWLFSAESLHVVKPASALERFRTNLRLGLVRRFDSSSADSISSAAGNLSATGSLPAAAGGWGGLALALLLGIRDNLDSGLAALYRDAGCSYVLALSGMHLAVLAGIIAFLLKKPLGLRGAAVAGALIIILYCFIVGPLPSLTRAALMYLLGVLALLGSLKRDALSLLAMAFLVQIVISPQAGFSLSFILSYLALAGILSAGEAINALGRGKVPACLLRPLSASLGAFLATAGITAYCFGILRPVGIVTGLVLVPLTTVFMAGSMAWLALDPVSPALSGLLSPALSLLYGVMEKTVSLASRVPGLKAAAPSATPSSAIPLATPLVLWSSLGLWLLLLCFAYRRRIAQDRLRSFA